VYESQADAEEVLVKEGVIVRFRISVLHPLVEEYVPLWV
jgi:hypothetical protein